MNERKWPTNPKWLADLALGRAWTRRQLAENSEGAESTEHNRRAAELEREAKDLNGR